MGKLNVFNFISLDGLFAGPNGESDWMTWDWDDQLKNYVSELTDSIDTILLGRKMTDGFISHWSRVKHDSLEYPFAQKFSCGVVVNQFELMTKALITS